MREFIEAYVEVSGEELLLADGFDQAILGIAEGCGRSPSVVYDYNQCVRILMERDGMDEDEAQEFVEVNVAGAYIGPATPLFLRRPQK